MKIFSLFQSKFAILICLMTFCLFNSPDVYGGNVSNNLKLTDATVLNDNEENPKRQLTLDNVRQTFVERDAAAIYIVIGPRYVILLTCLIANPETEEVVSNLQQVARKYKVSSQEKNEDYLEVELANELSRRDQEEVKEILSKLNPKHYKVDF